MGRNLSPVLRRELANLEKGADSRKQAMKALKSYVKDLDSKTIPLFLAQVSETKDPGSMSGEYTISLYEILARVHGPNIVPQINSIMETIIKTLASSAGSFPLQQACSRVIPAIARYGIDLITPDDKKRHIIHSLCKPLCNSLLASQESLSSGSALCLKALVDSDNWRFASDEMVNKVCQNATAALQEKCSQTNSQMGLTMALAKHNTLVVEAYARLLIKAGLRILNAGVVEGNSQKCLSAIQMVNYLMKCLDSRSVFSELDVVIEEMEKCQSDPMAYVKGAAFEALQTARKIALAKESQLQCSVTGSNFSSKKSHNRNKNTWISGDFSPKSISAESQTLDSFLGYDSLVESPLSLPQTSRNAEYERRSVNRKLWSHNNGGVDISLKDGLFSGISQEKPICNAFSENRRQNFTEEFSGFSQSNPTDRLSRSCTPIAQIPRSGLIVDEANIQCTPSKLIHSLQDPGEMMSDVTEKLSNRFKTPTSRKYENSSKFNQDGYLSDDNHKEKSNGSGYAESIFDSVSSADVCVKGDVVQVVSQENKGKTLKCSTVKKYSNWKPTARLIIGALVTLLVIFCLIVWTKNGQDQVHLVPT